MQKSSRGSILNNIFNFTKKDSYTTRKKNLEDAEAEEAEAEEAVTVKPFAEEIFAEVVTDE